VWASTSAVISIGIDAVVHQVATFQAQLVTQILARSAMVRSICPEQRSRLNYTFAGAEASNQPVAEGCRRDAEPAA
jgi:hypothetical protein